MNKTAKGGLAAGAAAVLLLGGAGTLAFWTGTATVNGGSAISGNLSIAPATGTNNPCDANWVYAPNRAKAGTAVTAFVPGDVITKNCRFTITAKGDNLSATPTVPSSVAVTAAPITGTASTASFSASVASAYALSNRANFGTVPTITETDNGATLTATLTVTIPFGTNELGVNPGGVAGAKVNTNDTQNIRASLADLTVALQQVNPNP